MWRSSWSVCSWVSWLLGRSCGCATPVHRIGIVDGRLCLVCSSCRRHSVGVSHSPRLRPIFERPDQTRARLRIVTRRFG